MAGADLARAIPRLASNSYIVSDFAVLQEFFALVTKPQMIDGRSFMGGWKNLTVCDLEGRRQEPR